MSDDKKSKPMKKTSAVPLRKETVRVTLKATPTERKSPPPAPAAPAAKPKPPAPAPTIPLKTSGPGTAKPPAPAPTVKLQTGAPTTKPATPATPAPTVKLNTPGTTGPGTVALTGGAASQPLPKATVQLQQTQPMGSPATPSQAATIRTADDDDSASSKAESIATGLSVVSLIAALVVLGIQLATANIWLEGKWGDLFN